MAGYIGTQAVSVNTTSATITGDASIGGDLSLGDSDKAIFGAGSDLQIHHDGSNSYVTEVGAGALVLQSNGTAIVLEKSDGENMILANTDGAVTLYFNGAAKLATKATGVTVTGEMAATTMDLSGAAQIDGNTTVGTAASSTNVEFNINGVASKATRIQFKEGGTNKWLLGQGAASETTAFELYNAGGVMSLSVNRSTNLATFANGLTLTDGNLTVATAHGIAFGNASGNTRTIVSNLLDEYEEGTCTMAPTTSGSNFAINAGASGARYTKIGNSVTLLIDLNFVITNRGSGYIKITGLPFTPAVGYGNGGYSCFSFRACSAFSVDTEIPVHGWVSDTNTLFPEQGSTSSATINPVAASSTTRRITGSITYLTAT